KRDELIEPFIDASRRNGLVSKNSKKGVLRTINNAIDEYENEPLKPLKEREKASTKKAKAHTNGSGNGATPPPPRDPPKEPPGDEPPPDRDREPHPTSSSAFALTGNQVGTWPDLTEDDTPVARSQANIRHFLEAANV